MGSIGSQIPLTTGSEVIGVIIPKIDHLDGNLDPEGCTSLFPGFQTQVTTQP